MTVTFTDTRRYSDFVKLEQWPEYGWCHKQVVVRETAETVYKVGTLLGKVTSTGKYKKAVETAVDGSKAFGAFCTSDITIPANTDVKLVVLYDGDAMVRADAIDFDSTYDNDAKKQVVYDAMEAVGIKRATTA